jgi:hypothetical protein
LEQAFLLTTSSVVTASLASFTLGVVMIFVVVGTNSSLFSHGNLSSSPVFKRVFLSTYGT